MWWQAFTACHRDRYEQAPAKSGRGTAFRFVVEQVAWPDGLGWMAQEVLVSDMFELMRDEVTRTKSRG